MSQVNYLHRATNLSIRLFWEKDSFFIWSCCVFALLLSLPSRLRILLSSNFSFGDGGLFIQIIEQLVENSGYIPYYYSYNGLEIPSAYPPIGFWIAYFMVSAFHFEPLNILRWLPLFFNLLTVITFVLVSWELLHDRLVTVFSSAVFALLPRSSEWVIMGGGLTRSPGFFLALAALWFAIRFTKTENLKSLIISALLCSASFLIHLEWGLSATLFVIFYLVLISPPQKRIFSLNIVGWTILILTSPWWAFVVHRYGTSPLLGALGTSGWNIRLSFLNITNLEFLGLVSYMGWVTIIGIVLQVQKRSWFLPLLLPLLQLSTPRHAQTPATIPVALLSGIALTQLTQLFIEFLHKSFSILQYRAKPIAIINLSCYLTK